MDVDGPRDPFESLKTLLIRAVVLAISWPLRYVAFFLNVPFVVSLVAMIAAIVLILQDVYGIAVVELMRQWLPFIGSRIPADLEFSATVDGQDILRLYGRVTFVLFVTGAVIREVFRLKPTTLRRRLVALLVVATLGWGFVIAHVPALRVTPDTSKMALGVTFFFFYFVGACGFAIGAVLTHASQAFVRAVLGSLENRTGT